MKPAADLRKKIRETFSQADGRTLFYLDFDEQIFLTHRFVAERDETVFQTRTDESKPMSNRV